jgi:hypothetical protein
MHGAACATSAWYSRSGVLQHVEQTFKELWADNGDTISRQYTVRCTIWAISWCLAAVVAHWQGTAALKGDFTRKGKRTMTGVLHDGVNSVKRHAVCCDRCTLYATLYASWHAANCAVKWVLYGRRRRTGRYVQNNFKDVERQAAIDMCLGNSTTQRTHTLADMAWQPQQAEVRTTRHTS